MDSRPDGNRLKTELRRLGVQVLDLNTVTKRPIRGVLIFDQIKRIIDNPTVHVGPSAIPNPNVRDNLFQVVPAHEELATAAVADSTDSIF